MIAQSDPICKNLKQKEIIYRNMRSKLIILLVFGAAIAYFLYIPYPDDCDYPLRMKAMLSLVKVIDLVGQLWVELGGSYSTPFQILGPKMAESTGTVDVSLSKLGDVEVAVFKPKGFDKKAPGAAMIYIHGGGFTIGSAALYARFTMLIAEQTGMLVLSPEYRLAPEHSFPAAFDDCLKVTQEFLSMAEDFNVDPKKIVLSGDSAGGNLATAVGLEIGKQNAEHSHPICMMNIIYPILQIGNFRLPAYLQNSHPPLLPPSMIVRFMLNYMGYGNRTELIPLLTQNVHMNGMNDAALLDRISEKWIPDKYKKRSVLTENVQPLTIEKLKPLFARIKKIQGFASDVRFSPLMANDDELHTLPSTHIMTCEYDVLRDDGIIFYERLKSLKHEVSHQHLHFAGHGVIPSYGRSQYDKLDRAVDKMFKIIEANVNNCAS